MRKRDVRANLLYPEKVPDSGPIINIFDIKRGKINF
jgi:hypothetical protein